MTGWICCDAVSLKVLDDTSVSGTLSLPWKFPSTKSCWKEATKIVNEDSPSAVVDRALSELIRIAQLKRGIQAMKDTSEVFWPNYLEELRPSSWAAYEKRKAS